MTDEKLAQLFSAYLIVTEEIGRLKALYEQQDEIVLALKDLGFRETDYGDKSYTLIDNFADRKNTAYRIAFVKRYELKVAKKKEGK
jgi:hypothetical protein